MKATAAIISVLAMAFFSSPQVAEILGTDYQKRATNGQLVITESNFFAKGEITGQANNFELIKTSLVEEEGVRNIHQAKLPAGEHLMLSGITLGWYKGSTQDSKGVHYRTDYDATNLDPALANARLVIRQDSNTLVDLPVERFLSSTGSDRAREHEGLNFDNMKLIEADKVFSIDIVFPNGATVDATASTYYFVNVQLKGQKIKRK